MNKTIKLILCACVFTVLLSVSSVSAPVTVGSYSYDNSGSMKLDAGVGVMGNIPWNHNGSWWYERNNVYSDYPVDEWTGNSYILTWDTPGRWYVSALSLERRTIIRWTDAGFVYSYTMPYQEENSNNHALTQMFESAWWAWDGDAKIVRAYYEIPYGFGPAGKFNTLKLRVVYPDGAERFYWIGDPDTSSLTFARQYEDEDLNSGGIGKYGQYAEAIWTITGNPGDELVEQFGQENIQVRIVITTVYNQARFEFQITNNTPYSKRIGLAMTGAPNVCDLMTPNWSQYKIIPAYADGSPIEPYASTPYDYTLTGIVKYKQVICFIPGVGQINRAKILSANEVPDKFEMYTYDYPMDYFAGTIDLDYYGFPSSQSYVTSARATLSGGDATKPDYLIVGNADNILKMRAVPFGHTAQRDGDTGLFDDGNGATSVWPEPGPNRAGFVPDPTYVFREQEYVPVVYMATWNATSVSSGATKQIITYYGMTGTDFTTGRQVGTRFYRDNMSLFVESPTYLSYNADADGLGEDGIYPKEFVVTARVVNMAVERVAFNLSNLKTTINLPKKGEPGYCGLILADGETATKIMPIDVLGVKSDVTVSWRVVATGDVSGNVSFTVDSEGKFIGNPQYQHPDLPSDDWKQTVVRKIMIPSAKEGRLTAPWTMAVSPFSLDRYTSKDEIYGTDTVAVFTWDPIKSGSGEYIQQEDLSKITPGQAYWIAKDKNVNIIDYKYPSDAKFNDVNTSIPNIGNYMVETHLTLYRGWNLIGNPYVFPAQWFNCSIRDKRTGDVATLKDAVEKNYWVGASLYNWDGDSRYKIQRSVTAEMLPNVGYWVYAYQDLELIFSPTKFPGTEAFSGGTDYRMGPTIPSYYDEPYNF